VLFGVERAPEEEGEVACRTRSSSCFIALSIALFLIVKVIPIFAGTIKDFWREMRTPNTDSDRHQ